MIQPILSNVHPNQYSQGLRCYPFAVNLNRFVGSSNTLTDLSNRVCVPNKRGDLNLNVFNIIKGINESKTLTKHASCKCECKFYSRKCNLNQRWNIDKCLCECKNPKKHVCKYGYIWNLDMCSCENGKYLESIIGDSVIMCDEIIDALAKSYDDTAKSTSTKTVPAESTSTNFYILLTFLLITIALFIAISVYCCFIKYRVKQKHLLPYDDTSKLKEIDIKNILEKWKVMMN